MTVSDSDLDAALRFAREYVYNGNEPLAAAVMPFARMLSAYRTELGHGAWTTKTPEEPGWYWVREAKSLPVLMAQVLDPYVVAPAGVLTPGKFKPVVYTLS